MKFYALARDGRHGAAAIWSGAKYAVFSAGRNRYEPCAHLYERPPGKKWLDRESLLTLPNGGRRANVQPGGGEGMCPQA